ncbi:MAG: sugar transferase, partial [Armatimonadetes bacterium]|nr:sugar transferase [Armatimonadota bacterium]
MAALRLEEPEVQRRPEVPTVPEIDDPLGYRIAKRALDIVVAALALLVALPVMAITAVAVKLESPGKVFFHQTRL